jgi:hypothetical protein
MRSRLPAAILKAVVHDEAVTMTNNQPYTAPTHRREVTAKLLAELLFLGRDTPAPLGQCPFSHSLQLKGRLLVAALDTSVLLVAPPF